MKLILKILSGLIFFSFLILSLLSYGITTDKFNSKIKREIEKNIENSNTYFEKASLSLDLLSLDLKIKIKNPIIEIDNQNINLKNLIIYTNLNSAFKNQYSPKKVEINLRDNKLIKLTKTSFVQKIAILKNVKILEGSINGKITIQDFQTKNLSVNFNGELKNSSIDIYENIPFIKNLNLKIQFENNKITFQEAIGLFGSFAIDSDSISYDLTSRYLTGKLNLNGKLNDAMNLNNLASKFLDFDLSNISNLSGNFNILTNLNVELDEKFNIKNNQSEIELKTNKISFAKTFEKKRQISEFNSFFKIKANGNLDGRASFKVDSRENELKVLRKNFNSDYEISLNGSTNVKEIFPQNSFVIEEDINYSFKTKIKNFNTFVLRASFDLTNSQIDLSLFNFVKNKGVSSKVTFDAEKIKKNFNIKNLVFQSNKNKISVNQIIFNEDLKIKSLDKININLGDKNNLQIDAKKNQYIIKGSSLDLTKILTKRGRNKDVAFDPLISGEVKVDLKNVFLPSANLINYKMSGNIKKGEIINLNSFANFDDLTTFSHEVKKNESGNKQLILRSDKAKPFVSNYEFLKGLEEGNLEINRETFSKDLSITEIKIENFYLKELPVLTKILSLASFTGIGDLLSGKGIFFKEAYLKYELLDGEMKIIECYGTGPSLGFLLEGRIGKDDFVSLRGSLAPANTINNIVRGIPLVGKILTGQKGDGIFGASFKIKGKDDFETEVNPIKTITPRFIQRFLSVFKK